MRQVNSSRIPVFVTGIVAIATLVGLATLSWQIYGIAGWRDEVYGLQGVNGSSRAMDDYREGYLRMYRLGGEQERAHFTGETNGVFEMWTPQYYPSMGAAHRYATEQFIAFYNRKMAYMHTHPDRFRRGTNTVQPATRSNSP